MRRFSRIPQAGSLEENWFSAIFLNDSAAYHAAVNFTNTSQLAPVVPQNVSIARVVATKDCFISYGDAPDAAGKMFLPAGIVEYFGVDPGKRFAVIRETTDGTLYIAYGSEQ